MSIPSNDPAGLSDLAPRRAGPLLRRVAIVLLLLVGVAYLAHVRSPLRLNTDAVVILTSAANYAAGHGLLVNGKPPLYPPLVLLTIAQLDRAGLARPPVLASLYLACVGAALFCWCDLLARVGSIHAKWRALLSVLLTLLCGALVKHAIIPLTDVPYCAASAGVLFLLSASENPLLPSPRRWMLLAAACILTLVAIGMRTVGITLLPAAAIAACHLAPRRRAGHPQSAARRTMVAAAGLVALVVLGLYVTRTQYFRDFLHRYSAQGDAVSITFTLKQRAFELGQLITNLPASRIPAKLNVLIELGGVLTLGLLLLGRWSLDVQAKLSGGYRLRSFDGMLLAYAGIMAVWPYSADTRFWLPVLPLLARYLIEAASWLTGRIRILQIPVLLWALGYGALGMLALVTSVKLTISRQHFVAGYGIPEVRSAYRVAWNLPQESGSPPPLADWVETIRHYDP